MQNPLGRYRDAIFFASGFAGLIYESIWTQYLKLFLGHAAYAQTLVLAIFMGGMAVGAGIAARYAAAMTNPLRTYVGIEAAIGLLALVFHPVFTATTGGFYDFAFNHHVDGTAFAVIKWGLASVLILPQSILLGATFPVFASAAARAAPAAEGRSIATLYFANGIGGAMSIVVSGFVLIPAIGLPGAIGTAGAINLAIATLVFTMTRTRAAYALAVPEAATATPVPTSSGPPVATAGHEPRPDATVAAAPYPRSRPAPATFVAAAIEPRFGSTNGLLLAVAFLTGVSSFIYEIGWIRMLSLVLGSATHSFELMLSAFLLGLAVGGLWIRKRIDRASNPGVLLGYVQIAMGCAAIATVPLHAASFHLVAWVMAQTPKTDSGYTVFNLMRYGVSALIMFPAAFCAGMTLPLATRILYSFKNQGERAIGLVYSANAVGAVVGVGLAVHVGLPVVGLNYLVASGAMLDVLLGVVLFAAYGERAKIWRAVAALILCTAGAAAAARTFDPQKLTSGVFRSGLATAQGTVMEIAHGKTATISVDKSGNFLEIKTNGKPDASANPNPQGAYSPDEITQRLLGIVPSMLHNAPARVASIGLGSGMTSATILMDPRVQRLDNIEIEPKVVDLARHFGDLNRSVYTDPRSALHIDDAKSFFAANGKTYDLIISEPSSPWVSGAAGLYSVEFYRHVVRYLNADGLFVQWLPILETNPERVVSMLKALDEVFDDYLVIALDWGDILLIGRPHGKMVMPENAYALLSPELKATLRGIEIANQADITSRIIGNKALWKPWLEARKTPANSDFYPYVDVNADRDRYLRHGWPDISNIAMSAYPISEILGGRPVLPTPSAISINGHFGPLQPQLAARLVAESLLGQPEGPEVALIPTRLGEQLLDQGNEIIRMCIDPPDDDAPLVLTKISNRVLPYLSPTEGRRVLAALDQAPCFKALSGPQTEWRTLLTHIADRNAKGIGESAEALLQSGQGVTEIRTRYLLGMAMLGLVGAGEPARARVLWGAYSRRAFGDKPPDLAFEIFLAHAAAAPARP